jgi:hypothetical protein
VLNDAESAAQDSFVAGLLDCPHYTRPERWLGESVPEVLLSGHHADIRRWRLLQALGRTAERRPTFGGSRLRRKNWRCSRNTAAGGAAAVDWGRLGSSNGGGNAYHNDPRASGGALRCARAQWPNRREQQHEHHRNAGEGRNRPLGKTTPNSRRVIPSSST